MAECFKCPTCGFARLEEPAWDPDDGSPSFSICPCCGCEFGYDDATLQARQQYREQWIRNGASWFEPELRPVDWNLQEQLCEIGYRLDPSDDSQAKECHHDQ